MITVSQTFTDAVKAERFTVLVGCWEQDTGMKRQRSTTEKEDEEDTDRAVRDAGFSE